MVQDYFCHYCFLCFLKRKTTDQIPGSPTALDSIIKVTKTEIGQGSSNARHFNSMTHNVLLLLFFFKFD